MKHVTSIRKMIAQGKAEEAQSALENLLALGPKNTEALKLRALLFHAQGKYLDEARVYEKILEIDAEDQDAIEFFLNQRHEDHEHFYYTELLADGSRRFHAYPKALMYSAMIGLAGCFAFLVLGKTTQSLPPIEQSKTLLIMFAILVMAPFASVIVVYFRSLKDITIGVQGLAIRSRIKTFIMHWTDIKQMILLNESDSSGQSLSLVLLPKDPQSPAIQIDLSDSSTSVRARSHFIRELSHSPIGLQYSNDFTLQKNIIKY